MKLKEAEEILGDAIKEDGGLFSLELHLSWEVGDEEVNLDGPYTVEELEAIIWWIRSKT